MYCGILGPFDKLLRHEPERPIENGSNEALASASRRKRREHANYHQVVASWGIGEQWKHEGVEKATPLRNPSGIGRVVSSRYNLVRCGSGTWEPRRPERHFLELVRIVDPLFRSRRCTLFVCCILMVGVYGWVITVLLYLSDQRRRRRQTSWVIP